MAIDRNVFIENFLVEASENLAAVESSILVLKRDPENQDELTNLMRALHTLKGSSRMLKFPTIESVSHGLETVLKGVRDGRYSVKANLIQLVFTACNFIRESLERIREVKDDTVAIAPLLDTYAKAEANEPFSLDWYQAGAETEPKDVQTSEIAADTIRIKTGRIDEILELHNDLVINQFQLKRQKEYFNGMEKAARALVDARTGGEVGGTDGGKDLAFELLNLVTSARTHFVEQMDLVERSSLDVQKSLLSLRMLPADLVLGLLPKMVEELSQSLGKDVKLEMSGTEVGLDRMVLEHLKDPLIHIVRNSVDHGIEPAPERERSGKSRTGTIRIQCALESGACTIRISDDGHGFDYDKIRRKAIATGAYSEDEIAHVDENALNMLLFTPGFSTKDEANAVSGRGVGLDIVRHEIESIKGKIGVKSVAGRGSEFTLTLPLSLATVNGFFVAVAGQRYLIPSAYIEEIMIYQKADEVMCMNRRSVLVREKIVPVYYLGTILGNAENEDSESYHALIVEYLGDLIGIIVDEVQQHASIIYKPLPPGLAGLKAVQGFVYDENFDMVTILVVPELVQRFRRSRGIDGKKRFSVDRSEYRRLLVVDDSFSTREIEKSILSMNGYQVETAVDGIEALEMLRAQRFDLIVTDINMPRMDGATLIENVRRDEKYRCVPILVVSSESDGEKRRELMTLGANGYILKADFDRGNLAQEVRYLLAQSAQGVNALTSPKAGGD